MQSTLPSTSRTSPLFQVYKPAPVNNCDAGEHTGYLELPDIDMSKLAKTEQFTALSLHSDFPDIKAQLLSDLNELKQLANVYISSQYDAAISTLYKEVEESPDHIRNSLIPFYRETRYLIHQVVARIKEYQEEGTCSGENRGVAAGSVAIGKDGITLLLHQCLEGLEHCLSGVHSRFMLGFLRLEAVRDGLPGEFWQIRSELHGRFIQSFIVEKQRAGIL